MYIVKGTDATVGDGFAPLGLPLLPWENHMGRGQAHTQQLKIRRRKNFFFQKLIFFKYYFVCEKNAIILALSIEEISLWLKPNMIFH